MIGKKSLLPFLSIALLVFVMTGCTGASDADDNTNPEVSIQNEESTVSASGEVVPENFVNLSYPSGGQNIEILVQAGEKVRTGQILARVNDESQKLAEAQALAGLKRAELALESLENQPTEDVLLSAQAALDSAEANYDLLDRRDAESIDLEAAKTQVDAAAASLSVVQAGPSRTQLDAARADLIAARAAMEQARKATRETVMTAPFDGHIVEVYVHTNEHVSPGQAIVLLADLDRLQIETNDLSEVDAARIQEGDRVEVSFDALPDQVLSGTVQRIARKTSGGSAANITAYITLEETPAGLIWGMTAFVIFPVY